MRLTVPLSLRPDRELVGVERRLALLRLYTAGTISGGIILLLLATMLVPIAPGIAIPGAPAGFERLAGLGVWVAFGLAGAARIIREPSGHGVLTLHLPFVVAAMALGGPVAGGWVAMLATFDRRELEEVPWYGVMANHCGLAIAAMAGGLVVLGIQGVASSIGIASPGVVTLLAALAATLVFSVISTGAAAGVIVLRDGLSMRETLLIFDTAFRTTAVAETVLGWMLTVAYLAVGWWSPALCAAVVVALWRANADHEALEHDELTGLLSRGAFAMRVAEAAERARRGIEASAYLFIDLDNFKHVNDRPGSHLIGDQVLAQVGLRLRRAIRVTDAAGRRGGDEFTVLLVGVRDEATAQELANRILDQLSEPYQTDIGEKRIGASVGVALVTPRRRDFEPDVRQRADQAMYTAKAAGGGIVVALAAPEA